MSLVVTGGAPSPALGGAGCTIEVRHNQHFLATNTAPGTGGWTDGGSVRYAGTPATLPGVNPWANGSAGATPVRGYAQALGTFFKRANNSAAGAVPIDWYCGVGIAPVVVKPAVDLPSALAVYEVGVQMALSNVPAANVDRDCGLVFVMSINTSFANCLRAGVAAGNDFAGFGVVFDALGDLRWICKKNGAAGGAALNESVLLASPGAQRIVPVKVRFYSATATADAHLTVYVDNVPVLARSWGAGTVLPVAADGTFTASTGQFRAMMRAAQSVASGVQLWWREEYLKAAPSAALLD